MGVIFFYQGLQPNFVGENCKKLCVQFVWLHEENPHLKKMSRSKLKQFHITTNILSTIKNKCQHKKYIFNIKSIIVHILTYCIYYLGFYLKRPIFFSTSLKYSNIYIYIIVKLIVNWFMFENIIFVWTFIFMFGHLFLSVYDLLKHFFK